MEHSILTLLHMVMCRDGEMDAAGPKPCASVQGTTLLVEDLFYNVNTRKQVKHLQGVFVRNTDGCNAMILAQCMQALKSSNDEFSRILDIVGRYAVYKAGVAFSCKRQVLLVSMFAGESICLQTDCMAVWCAVRVRHVQTYTPLLELPDLTTSGKPFTT